MPEPMREWHGASAQALDPALLGSAEPVLLRGLVSDWPVVQAAKLGANALADYLRRFDRREPVVAFVGSAEMGGRYFYNEDLSGFNFSTQRVPLSALLDRLLELQAVDSAPAIYLGSTDLDLFLPGFRDENDLTLPVAEPLASLWLGNRSRIAAHQDLPDNLACVVAGRRRFTLFPPDQLANLYIGPLDFTPAGQAISLVDFERPDYTRFPRFAEALQVARVVELEPGDALFIPSLWWHHVESLGNFNGLVNYWWRRVAGYMDAPINALMLAIMSLRDLPAHERSAWQQIFQHYVFAADETTAAHIPAAARRALGPMDEDTVRALRARLLKRINR